jgi:hypothetical protein
LQARFQLQAQFRIDKEPSLPMAQGRHDAAHDEGVWVTRETVGERFVGLEIELISWAIAVLPSDGRCYPRPVTVMLCSKMLDFHRLALTA